MSSGHASANFLQDLDHDVRGCVLNHCCLTGQEASQDRAASHQNATVNRNIGSFLYPDGDVRSRCVVGAPGDLGFRFPQRDREQEITECAQAREIYTQLVHPLLLVCPIEHGIVETSPRWTTIPKRQQIGEVLVQEVPGEVDWVRYEVRSENSKCPYVVTIYALDALDVRDTSKLESLGTALGRFGVPRPQKDVTGFRAEDDRSISGH